MGVGVFHVKLFIICYAHFVNIFTPGHLRSSHQRKRDQVAQAPTSYRVLWGGGRAVIRPRPCEGGSDPRPCGGRAGGIARTALEPFSGVEIHMEMDMDWKWMEMGHNL